MDQNETKPAADRPLPGHETQSGEMTCPACGRFVGAAVKCPYCGAKAGKRMSLVALRWAAVLLSTVGLVLLWLMAKTREPELVKIGSIEPTMNYGSVRLAGKVKSDARPFRNGNGFSFNVDDGTGSIIVFVDQAQRQAMVEGGLVPKRGDAIDFVVQLQASSSGNSARIRGLGPDSFKLVRGGAKSAEPAAAEPAPAAARESAAPGPSAPFPAIDESLAGKTVVLEGTVVSIREPKPGTKQPYALELTDGTTNLFVKFWADQYLQLDRPASLPGAAVRVEAGVKPYRGKPELTLKKGSDLRRVAAADAAPGETAAGGSAE